MNFSGIITAAGLSSRMGAFKPLLEINGLPMIAHTVMSMKNAGISPICVVTGHRGAEVQSALARYDVIFAENPSFASSDMLASIKLGINKVYDSDGFFLLPGDMPLISPQAFKAVSETQGNYIIPTVQGKNAHPPLIKNPCFDSILSFSGDGGLPMALTDFEKCFVETGDLFSNKDADYMHEFKELRQGGKMRLGLSDELCSSLLNDANTPAHIQAHCFAVGKLAYHMAHKLAENGFYINLLLCRSGGMLHDIMRLEPHHAEIGANYLKALGYDAVSDIVRHHMTSEGLPLDFNECTVVYLADKLVHETELVTPSTRYAPALEKFPKGTEVGDRIIKDMKFAEMLLSKYIKITGDTI